MPAPVSRRRALLGGAALALPLGGCLGGDDPRIPVFGYNAGTSEHRVRVLVDGPGDESDPDGATYHLSPGETRRLQTATARTFDLRVWFEDSGAGGSTATLEVSPDGESYSEAGYLVVVRDEPVDGEYVHVEVLPADPG